MSENAWRTSPSDFSRTAQVTALTTAERRQAGEEYNDGDDILISVPSVSGALSTSSTAYICSDPIGRDRKQFIFSAKSGSTSFDFLGPEETEESCGYFMFVKMLTSMWEPFLPSATPRATPAMAIQSSRAMMMITTMTDMTKMINMAQRGSRIGASEANAIRPLATRTADKYAAQVTVQPDPHC